MTKNELIILNAALTDYLDKLEAGEPYSRISERESVRELLNTVRHDIQAIEREEADQEAGVTYLPASIAAIRGDFLPIAGEKARAIVKGYILDDNCRKNVIVQREGDISGQHFFLEGVIWDEKG